MKPKYQQNADKDLTRFSLFAIITENDIFLRCNNISSQGLFSYFIITFCLKNKVCKVIDDEIMKRK